MIDDNMLAKVEGRAAELAQAAAEAAEAKSAKGVASGSPSSTSGAGASPGLDKGFVLERLRRNRVGDADLYCTLFRDKYVYVEEWGRWLYWADPGGLNLWKCDVSLFSSDLAYKLTIAPTDPGAFHLHTNADGMLEQYAREMCVVTYSEEDHAWVNPKRKANHFWDCEKMTLALAHIFNVRHTARPGVAPKVKKPARQQAQRHCGTPSVGDMLSTIRR